MPRAVAFALSGTNRDALAIARGIAEKYPAATRGHEVYVPLIRASIALAATNFRAVLTELEPAGTYERRWPRVSYLRGLAYLQLREPVRAIAEFEKPSAAASDSVELYWRSLCTLGIARARALAGDRVGSRKEYERLFAMWKDADPNLPPLIAARSEYASLAGRD